MSDTYECVRCHKKRRGRFTRPKSGLPGAWSKGDSQRRDIPNWYCFICLPQGLGRDEEDVAASKTVTPSAQVVNLQREHQRGLALVNPLVEQLSALTIEDEASYLQADALLGKIRNALKQWGTVWDMIQDRVIKPQREALDGVYSVNREVSGPMEKAEKLLKSKMKDYKDEEAKRIAQEIADRDAETDRLQQQIDDAKRREEMAKTPQARRVAQRQIVALDSTQRAVIENTPMAVQGSSSSTRTVKVPIVTNLQHLMMALSVGSLKAETALWDKIYESVQAIIKTEGKSQARKDEMAMWPGITIQDETQIVGR